VAAQHTDRKQADREHPEDQSNWRAKDGHECTRKSFFCIHWPFLPQLIGVAAAKPQNIWPPNDQVDAVKMVHAVKMGYFDAAQ
jgi:hypothetical protein